MALRFMDGLDSVGGTTDFPEWLKYAGSGLGDNGHQYQSTSGKFGGGAMVVADPGTSTVSLTVARDYGADICIGFWFLMSDPAATTLSLFTFEDAGTGASGDVELQIGGFLSLKEIVTSGGSVLSQTAQSLNDGAWHWIEIRLKADNSVGVADIYVDGVAADTFSGDTNVNGSLAFDSVRIVADSALSSNVYYLDDIIIYDDTTGGDAEPRSSIDFPLGPLKIETIVPDSTGSNAGFTSNSTAANWENVDETPPDDDTSYNSSTSYSAVDTHNFSTLATTEIISSVIGVQVSGVGRKDGANTMLGETVVISSGSTANGTPIGLSTAYDIFTQIHTEDPATSTRWTTASLDAVEFGYALSSST